MASNDNKKLALLLLGKVGAIPDMFQENSYWKTQPNAVGGNSGDVKKSVLRAKGYTGALGDMEAQHWKDVAAGGGGGGGGSAGSHIYWRLNITANSGNVGSLCIDEIEMMGSVGGVDQCTGGTAASSSNFGAGFTPSTAFSDTFGGANNYWMTSTGATTGWISYQFASPVSVAQYKIYPMSDVTRAPKSWTLEYSDSGVVWTVAHTVTNETGWVNGVAKVYTL